MIGTMSNPTVSYYPVSPQRLKILPANSSGYKPVILVRHRHGVIDSETQLCATNTLGGIGFFRLAHVYSKFLYSLIHPHLRLIRIQK